jgi:hypothetical protein
MPGASSRTVFVAAVLSLSGCGGRVAISLPDGPGVPLGDPAERFAMATAGCADVRSVVAEARVSGSVGRTRVRATLLVGADRDGNARIEALAGPGGPVLVLTARAEAATLVLPREQQVLQDASVEQVLEALVGVPLRADDLAMTLTGCAGAGQAPAGGRSYRGGADAFDLAGGTTVWTRGSTGGSRAIAWRRGSLTVAYERNARARPSRVRLVVTDARQSGAEAADLTITLSRVDVNEPIDPDAFVARVPRNAQPVTLDALRRSGPLGGAARP